MGSTCSLLWKFSTFLDRISAFLLLLLLLVGVEGQARSSEVGTLLRFKAANQAITLIYSESGWVEIYSAVGYWSTWKETDESPCAWVGVTCTTNSTVEALDLSGWGLNKLYESSLQILANLPDLRRLDLSSNDLGNFSTIPQDIQSLTGLTLLDLSRNFFSGPIPPWIFVSRSLQYISLENNQFSGVIPYLGGMEKLQVLVLADNLLTGPFPQELALISSLITIDLSSNQLSGIIPSLSNLSNLVDLKLGNNNFTELEGSLLPGMESLEHFIVSLNQLQGMIPSRITKLLNLKVLNMSHNRLSGGIPLNISACKNLQYISLEQNQLSGDIPNLGGLVNLRVLLLGQNQLSGPFPRAVGDISSIVTIDLSNNMLSGSLPLLSNLTRLVDLKLDNNRFTNFEDGLGGALLPGTESLEHLFVSGNLLIGPIRSVASLRKLKVLDLSRNRFTGAIPEEFSEEINSSLTLDFSENLLTGPIPPNLLPSTTNGAIYSLNLSHNFFSGSISVNGLEKQRNYRFLDLSHNVLFGPVPFSCSNGSSISILRLGDNRLSGDIVDEVFFGMGTCLRYFQELSLENNLFTGDMTRMANINTTFNALEVLDLSNNQLQMSTTEAVRDPLSAMLDYFNGGAIREFRMGGNNFNGISVLLDSGNYSFLEVLDLSNNHLQGEILATVFNSTCLPVVKYLNFSYNDLTGPVPESIVILPNLGILDVANNSLSGPLPAMSSNNRLYNASFFAGNKGLCGPPLPPCPDFSKKGVQWWVLFLLVGGCGIIALGSFLVAMWLWRSYSKRHQQDADLIRTLMGKESATLMPLRDLRKATHNFARSMHIGEGGFGDVYMGRLKDETLVAIKKSKREGCVRDKEQFLNEVRVLSHVSHRHLVKLLGCCMENKISLLVFEFISNGTLQDHLRGKSGAERLNWKQRLNIAVQTADALNYLHSAATIPIYHRDVKSANILLNDDLNAKVADFGISKLVPIEATHVSTMGVQGTIGYIDPEYYTSYQLTDKSDVYSFGVVMLELISAKPAIDFSRGGEETGLVNFSNPYIESGNLQQFIDPYLMETYNDSTKSGRESILSLGRLALRCLDMRSKARPSMKEVWKELQNLWLELNDTSKLLSPIMIEDDDEDREVDYTTLLCRSLSNPSSSVIRNHGTSEIEMSRVSSLKT